MYLEENGAKKAVPSHLNEQVVAKHGQVAAIEGNSVHSLLIFILLIKT